MVLYLLFLLSGVSGLIYQVVWVRAFGNVFGNTVYSASIVVAIFMLGLGAGSLAIGRWADRRYARAPESLLGVYARVELTIAALGLAVSVVLPALSALSAAVSSYVAGPHGWLVLSPSSHIARALIAVVLLAPITLLMGGTLTLLVRHVVRRDLGTSGWAIARLYAVNTAGAAAGAFLTDFLLVPAFGLRATQIVAVALNVLAGVGALALARRQTAPITRVLSERPGDAPLHAAPSWIALALALSGLAAMGMEILWLRHFTLLLGGFRAVFSLVLTVMLAAIGAGALAGGALDRRIRRPIESLMVVQALFVATALAGLAAASAHDLAARAQAIDATLASLSPLARWWAEVWYDLRPILIAAGPTSLLMGCAFPLANAAVQRVERDVGARAGLLYFANTVGAVGGSLLTGYVLLPQLGLQGSATLLMMIAAGAILALVVARQPFALRGVAADSGARPQDDGMTQRRGRLLGAAAMALVTLVIVAWARLPGDFLVTRALPPAAGERVLVTSEGVGELVQVTEAPGRGRGLVTNGHPMSSTALLDQRYMRALAHIPLLAMPDPERVLVIGFGVGNSTHAATLHASVQRVEVADLSRHVLEQADYFRDANGGVLTDPRVQVFVNDGRQHLLMQPQGTYDLITLEPPPIAHAGVAALYSRDFYTLARSRLRPGGSLSQWLPAYQVPAETTLAMVRAFVEVFPQSVVLSGMQAELLLVGTTAARMEIDPEAVKRALTRSPAAAADLQRLDLGTPTEIVGSFVGSGETLARAAAASMPVTDDRPAQEYGVRSVVGTGLRGVPESLFDLTAAGSWCPRCFDGDQPSPAVAELDGYLALLEQAYRSPVAAIDRSGGEERRRLLGSAYLGAVVPDTDAVANVVGVMLLRERRFDEAAARFRDALARRPDSPDANRNLGTVLAELGRTDEAVHYLERAVAIDPGNGGAHYELGTLLLGRKDYAAAARHLEAALKTMPQSAAAHNDLGVALASMGNQAAAVAHFREAVRLQPDFAEGRRNLDAALRQ